MNLLALAEEALVAMGAECLVAIRTNDKKERTDSISLLGVRLAVFEAYAYDIEKDASKGIPAAKQALADLRRKKESLYSSLEKLRSQEKLGASTLLKRA